MAKTATFSTTDGEATLEFSWTSEKVKMQTIANRAAHYLHKAGYGDQEKDFDDLTTQEKADILLDYATVIFKDLANDFYINSDEGGIEEVRATRIAEVDGLHEMGS